MNEYDFTVILESLPGSDLDAWADRLFETCGDRLDLLAGVKGNLAYVDVGCESASLQHAIAEAVRLIRSAGATVTGVELPSTQIEALVASDG